MLETTLSLRHSRRVFLVSMGLFALTAIAPKASAGEEWCTDDPPITLLVHGRPVTVNTFFSVPISQREALPSAQVTGEARGSTITITAVMPGTKFTVSSEIPALGRAAGNRQEVHPAGHLVTLRFTGLTPALLGGGGLAFGHSGEGTAPR